MPSHTTLAYNKHFFLTTSTAQSASKVKPTVVSLKPIFWRMYTNQLALEAALMELTLYLEQQDSPEVGNIVRGALETIGENAVFTKQVLAKLKASSAG